MNGCNVGAHILGSPSLKSMCIGAQSSLPLSSLGKGVYEHREVAGLHHHPRCLQNKR